MNDDGLSLDVTNKWNRYDIAVTGQFSDTNAKITVSITQLVASTTTISKDDPTCNAVNQNDYINQLYIYNASAFQKAATSYDVNGTKTDGKTIVKLGTATTDAATDRIIFSAAKGVTVCMSSYPTIVFTPSK